MISVKSLGLFRDRVRGQMRPFKHACAVVSAPAVSFIRPCLLPRYLSNPKGHGFTCVARVNSFAFVQFICVTFAVDADTRFPRGNSLPLALSVYDA